MWKKILPLIFFGSFIVASGSNVVSCNILKQHQLPFNLKNWKDSWAFTTQSIWQAMGYKKSGIILKQSEGLFLYRDKDEIQNINVPQLFKRFDDYGIAKSRPEHVETYLQLKYFIPSIIWYNEKPYKSPLKNLEAIERNFAFTYDSETDTKINSNIDEDNNFPSNQSGPAVELIWRSNQGETISAYFDVTIKLKNPSVKNIDGKLRMASSDGYYIDSEENSDEITWSMGVYFYLPNF